MCASIYAFHFNFVSLVGFAFFKFSFFRLFPHLYGFIGIAHEQTEFMQSKYLFGSRIHIHPKEKKKNSDMKNWPTRLSYSCHFCGYFSFERKRKQEMKYYCHYPSPSIVVSTNRSVCMFPHLAFTLPMMIWQKAHFTPLLAPFQTICNITNAIKVLKNTQERDIAA